MGFIALLTDVAPLTLGIAKEVNMSEARDLIPEST